MTPPRPLRVLVVDDSATVRQAFAGLLPPRHFRVTTAADPIFALAKMRHERPDVIVADLEMPRMDGLTFVQRVMARDPIPVIVCSALTAGRGDAALRALEAGAVAIVDKPRLGVKQFLEESALTLADAIRAAAAARLRRRPCVLPAAQPRRNADVVLPLRPTPTVATSGKVVAIGASTGGTEALREILEALTPDVPGIVVVQHMPEVFTRAFAQRLDASCRIEVKEAENGDRVLEGRALIAPGNRHLALRRTGGHYEVELIDGPLVSRHRPSVDVLFRSVAQVAGPAAVGVLLTGMGDDGAQGLLEMKNAGARTIAQDEQTSVVFGMPREAIERGAVDEIVPLHGIAARLRRAAENPAAGAIPAHG